MGVDYFWKRAPAEAIGGMTPKDLAELVPYWFDDEFASQQDAGLVVGAEDTGALIEALIGMGAARTRWETAARAFCSRLADWNDYRMVGTVDTETVGLIADLLAAAPIDTWATQHHTDLAEYARELGYQRPFDDDWAEQVVRDIRELAELFRAAAASREAIILKIVA